MDIGELLDYKPPQAVKRPVENENDDVERQRKMRRIARDKANKMSRAASPTPSLQTLDQISEEERQEILKFVETEQTEANNKLVNIEY
jgi:hypothetical protein